ncbi:hypothetical protein Zmor_016359 [Zophobas morio]|uniref:Pre-mRNA-splicing factor 18 n=1 Tax=Zophobas morio TaxID=2755281 RepID=A0AA38HFW6_9CUCU|nr:hypothetical protein Zmor_016359 [Zophobas morio]
MGFTSVLQAELLKSKSELDLLKSTSGSYIKQGEYIRNKYKRPATKERSLEINKLAKRSVRTELLPDNTESQQGEETLQSSEDGKNIKDKDSLVNSPSASTELLKKKLKISEIEVMKQLRDRNEPIRLFGESDEARLKRLQYIKTHESEEVGLRNDLMLAEDEAQQKFLDEILNLSGQDPQQLAKEKEKKRKEVKMVIDLTKGELLELIGKAGKNDYFINQEFTLKFVQTFKLLYISELAKYNQTKAYLQPLMEKLQLRTLDEDMAFFFSQIVTCCLKREYIEADELYMKLSIGNAAWPIGVTMVGIHARTGREKIFSGKVAHVLNDEEQRKYIQAFKRLVTFCAKKFPTDPSKMLHSLHVSSL